MDNNLAIGFPLPYYSQFVIDKVPNSGWSVENLILDIAIIWILATGIYVWMTKRTNA